MATVSTPTWMSSSMPSGEVTPTACLVSVTEEISPSKGATITPSVGLIPTPRPRTPAAKVSSGISSEGNALPETGAYTVPGWQSTVRAGFWDGAGFFSAGAASLKPKNQVSTKATPADTAIMMM